MAAYIWTSYIGTGAHRDQEPEEISLAARCTRYPVYHNILINAFLLDPGARCMAIAGCAGGQALQTGKLYNQGVLFKPFHLGIHCIAFAEYPCARVSATF